MSQPNFVKQLFTVDNTANYQVSLDNKAESILPHLRCPERLWRALNEQL